MKKIIDNNYRGYFCNVCNTEKVTDVVNCYNSDCIKSVNKLVKNVYQTELRVIRNDSYLPENFMRVYNF